MLDKYITPKTGRSDTPQKPPMRKDGITPKTKLVSAPAKAVAKTSKARKV